MQHIGEGVTFGKHVIIEDDVYIGDGCHIGHRVTLKSGTHLCDNVTFDDHCISTGACWIGENVNIRTGAIISKATVVEPWVFIGPGVVTNHTKHVPHGRPNMKHEQLLTYIGYGSIIGSQASLLAGVTIGYLTIVGGGAVVVKQTFSQGIYLGSPAKACGEIPDEYRMEVPPNVGRIYRTQEVFDHLQSYMPNFKPPVV